MPDNERAKFRNLLELAARSPYDGERRNALAAAERIARRHGMSVREAAAAAPPEPERKAPPQPSTEVFRQAHAAGAWRDASALNEERQREEKARWQAAVQAARDKGLDGGAKKNMRAFTGRRSSFRKRDPHDHARALLAETRIPFTEIATITGLDIYQVVGMKLKMRRPLRQQAVGG